MTNEQIVQDLANKIEKMNKLSSTEERRAFINGFMEGMNHARLIFTNESEEENPCGKPHNNAESEDDCLECQIIKKNI